MKIIVKEKINVFFFTSQLPLHVLVGTLVKAVSGEKHSGSPMAVPPTVMTLQL